MLGPFELIEVIGEGGMGVVWRGRHHRTREPVAIKVLLEHFATAQKYLESFHWEVRAAARLDHPGVVPVYDHGVVSAEAAASAAGLHQGSLWLAMEYVDGGALEDHLQDMDWPELKALLLQLLDALSHAHARELIHRDLKPANVLSRGEVNGQIRWALTDFGIAHVTDASVSEHTDDIEGATAGTPHFMSPEQLHGKWRDYGPWTDLYALGCLAYLLSTGRPPFDGETMMSIALKHLSDEVPPLAPRFPVPPGFENWVGQLLEKSIDARYRHAADAAGDLLRLGEPMAVPGQAPVLPATLPTLATLTELPEMATRILDLNELEGELAKDRRAPETGSFQLVLRRQLLPPKDWRRAGEGPPPAALLGTGKGIFRFRQIPFVGREAERDKLWSTFCQVCHDGTPRCVTIEGAPGLGKTSLATWLATRTDEMGLATVLTAAHSPIMSATEGLPWMFQAFLGATGLERRPLMKRLERTITDWTGVQPEEDFLAALVEWMNPRGPDADDDLPQVKLESPLERYTLAENLLRRIATARPVILTIDDGQWGQDSLGFVRHLLTTVEPGPLPVTILITLRTDALKGRLVESEFLELIDELDESSRIHLGPLNVEDQQRLIGRSMGLAPQLVARVGRETGGNPLFAIQLIEEWLERDELLESDDGYMLAADASFPQNLPTLLEARLDRFFDEMPRQALAREQTEAAAALGIDLDDQEWAQVCQALGTERLPTLADHLMMTGVLLPRHRGWRFRLPLYRDVLAEISGRRGRWSAINVACARTVNGTAENGTCLAERKARYFLAADAFEEALPLLWKAIMDRMKHSAYIQMGSLLNQVDKTLDALGAGPHEDDRARAQLLRAEALRYRGYFDDAEELLQEVMNWPTSLSTDLTAHSHRVLASLYNFAGRPRRGLLHYRQALTLFDEVQDSSGMAKSHHGMGWSYTVTGDLPAARQAFHDGYEDAMAAGDHLEAAWCLHGVCETAYFSGDHTEAESLGEEVLTLFESHGCRSGMALVLRTLGDVERHRDEIDAARARYTRARHLAQSTGHVMANVSAGLLGLCDLDAGLDDDAQRRFTVAHLVDRRNVFPVFRPLAPTGLLVLAAEGGRWNEFDVLVEELQGQYYVDSPLRQDFLRLLKRAKTACEHAGQTARAADCDDFLAQLSPPEHP